jgi:hypothetical protein
MAQSDGMAISSSRFYCAAVNVITSSCSRRSMKLLIAFNFLGPNCIAVTIPAQHFQHVIATPNEHIPKYPLIVQCKFGAVTSSELPLMVAACIC